MNRTVKLIVIGLGAGVVMLLGAVFLFWLSVMPLGFGGAGIDVRGVYSSPTGSLTATLFTESGGGAAGYVYEVVNVRRSTDPFDSEAGVVLVLSHGDATVVWTGDNSLSINYPATANVLKKRTSWGKAEHVQIAYPARK